MRTEKEAEKARRRELENRAENRRVERQQRRLKQSSKALAGAAGLRGADEGSSSDEDSIDDERMEDPLATSNMMMQLPILPSSSSSSTRAASKGWRRSGNRRGRSTLEEGIGSRVVDVDVEAERYLIVPSSPHRVPPLCFDWARDSCSGYGRECPKRCRHYFTSAQEREDVIARRLAEDMVLEKTVVACITEREALLDDVKDEAQRLHRQDQERTDVDLPSAAEMGRLLILLSRLRSASVRTIEAISRWKAMTEKRQKAMVMSKSKKDPHGRKYSVRLAVNGPRLYKNSPEFVTKLKRMQRPEETRGGRIPLVIYLGEYETELEATRVYEEAVRQEAVRLGTSVQQMPAFRIATRSCEKHYSVESVGLPSRPCEVCSCIIAHIFLTKSYYVL